MREPAPMARRTRAVEEVRAATDMAAGNRRKSFQVSRILSRGAETAAGWDQLLSLSRMTDDDALLTEFADPCVRVDHSVADAGASCEASSQGPNKNLTVLRALATRVRHSASGSSARVIDTYGTVRYS